MKIRASVAGGTGYTAGELLRILQQHPAVEVVSVSSTSKAGAPIHTAHPDLEGIFDQPFDDTPLLDVDVLFLCLGHGVSKSFLEKLTLPNQLKIIDLSRDFRYQNSPFQGRDFVYGLPELKRDKIIEASNIANPGCFATAIQLALLPFVSKYKPEQEVHISAITGSTGAGGTLSPTTHFTWRNNNISSYKVFTHQHLGEIEDSFRLLKGVPEMHFVPMRGDFTRGIFANVYMKSSLTETEAINLYQDFYNHEPFVQVSQRDVSLKTVVNTNRCFLQVRVIEGRLYIASAIDNLVKGASGQAVQNMNLIFGLDETLGLQLKPTML